MTDPRFRFHCYSSPLMQAQPHLSHFPANRCQTFSRGVALRVDRYAGTFGWAVSDPPASECMVIRAHEGVRRG
jgi:hypothetical protein